MFDSTGKLAAISRAGFEQTLTPITTTYQVLPTDDYLELTIPAAAANDYTVTMPSVSSVPHGKVIYLYLVRAAAYNNGTTTIADKANDTKSGMDDIAVTADQSLYRCENVGQRHWHIVRNLAGAANT
jgi:hypothetical protein